MNTQDPFNLQRFLGAQESFYAQALKEIRNGQKTSHWIWFIFPQLRGLGHSPMADNYGISSLDEAMAYWEHPILHQRLVGITESLLKHSKRRIFHSPKTAFEILGTIDAIKVRSCMTLFDMVEPNSIFAEVINAFYEGERDPLTLEKLSSLE